MDTEYARITRLGANLLTDYLLCDDNQRVFWEILFPALASDTEHPNYRAVHTKEFDLVFLVEQNQVSYTRGSEFEVLVMEPGENEDDLSMGDLLVDCLVDKFSFFFDERLGRVDMKDRESILQFDAKVFDAIDSGQIEGDLLSVLLHIRGYIQQYQAGFPDYLITGDACKVE